MGTTIDKKKQQGDGYLVGLDHDAPFYDYTNGGLILPDDPSNPEYIFFEKFFLKYFPGPDMGEREFNESPEEYLAFKLSNLHFRNDYNRWIYQIWAHIKKGYRVGIPYLKNTPRFVDGKNIVGYNLPPTRWRHRFNYPFPTRLDPHPLREFYGPVVGFMLYIKKRLGLNASNDQCNRFFDAMIYDFTLTTENIKHFDDVMKEIDKILWDLGAEICITTVNEDQDQKCLAPLLPGLQGELVDKIYAVWGKEGLMKMQFPHSWLRFADNIYGDGKQVDPEGSPFGVPRLFDDFQKNAVEFYPGPKSNYKTPPKELIDDAIECGGRFYADLDEIIPSKKKFEQIQVWLTNVRWRRMQDWILAHHPHVLYYYYTIWSQYQTTHYTLFTSMMNFLIYRHVAMWMISQKEKWSDQIGDVPLLSYEEWLKFLNVGQTYEIVNNDGVLTKKYTRISEDIIEETNYRIKYTLYGQTTLTERIVFDFKQRTTTFYDEFNKIVNVVKDNLDGTVTYTDKRNGEDTSTLINKENGDIITVIYPEWEPNGYHTSIKRKNVFFSQKMNHYFDIWLKSYINLSDKPLFTSDINISLSDIPQNDRSKMGDDEYFNLVLAFIKEYPIARPSSPSIFQTNYQDTIGNALGVEFQASTHEKACRVQWVFYLLWVESNVNAYGKNGYQKPGSKIKIEGGIEIINTYPNTGILAPYSDNVGKFVHFLTFGLTSIFGDQWWLQLLNELKRTFDLLLAWLKKFLDDYGFEILFYLGVASVIIGGGFLIYDYVDEIVKEKAKNK